MITSKEKNKQGTSEKELEVTIDNGDLKIIKSLVDAYGFKDENSLIKFAVGSLLQGINNEGLFTIRTGEDKKKSLSKIEPSTDMLKERKEE